MAHRSKGATDRSQPSLGEGGRKTSKAAVPVPAPAPREIGREIGRPSGDRRTGLPTACPVDEAEGAAVAPVAAGNSFELSRALVPGCSKISFELFRTLLPGCSKSSGACRPGRGGVCGAAPLPREPATDRREWMTAPAARRRATQSTRRRALGAVLSALKRVPVPCCASRPSRPRPRLHPRGCVVVLIRIRTRVLVPLTVASSWGRRAVDVCRRRSSCHHALGRPQSAPSASHSSPPVAMSPSLLAPKPIRPEGLQPRPRRLHAGREPHTRELCRRTTSLAALPSQAEERLPLGPRATPGGARVQAAGPAPRMAAADRGCVCSNPNHARDSMHLKHTQL